MDVTAASSQTSGANSSTGASGQSSSGLPSAAALQNQFMQLLTAQLKYQDPLKPMDNTQFTAQLAQFSQLAQLSNLNTTMGNLSNNVMAGNLIGKYVETASKGFTQVTGESFSNGQASLVLSDNSSVSPSGVTQVKNSI